MRKLGFGWYLAIGLAFIVGKAGTLKKKIDLAPAAWRRVNNPMLLGLAFGLNIPACATPILFGLLGLAATTGTVLASADVYVGYGQAILNQRKRIKQWTIETRLSHRRKSAA